MEPTNSNTFCWMPFFQIAIKTFNNDGTPVDITPCCNAIRTSHPNSMGLNGKAQHLTPPEIFYGEEFNELRQALLNNQKHPVCDTCWKIEEQGRTSYRLLSAPLPLLEIDTSTLIEDPQLLAIDTISSTKCNLRCRMCSPGSSHKLDIERQAFEANGTMEEIEDLTMIPWVPVTLDHGFRHTSIQLQWMAQEPTGLKMLKVSGGEPLYDEDFINFLHEFTRDGKAAQTTLMLHTNATQFNNRAMAILNKFYRVDLTFSIDSYGKNYEYIRHPMTWTGLTKSIDNFLKRIEIGYSVSVNTVLQSSNILHMQELINWCETKEFFIEFSDLNPSGRALDLIFMPRHLLEVALQRISEPHKYPKLVRDLEFFINNSKSSEQARERLRRELALFDAVKGQSYRDFLDPLLVDYLDAPAKYE